MAIKRPNPSLRILLTLVVVAYALVASGDAVFALETKDTESLASITAVAQVDKNEIKIGDKINFRISVKYKDDVAIQFPDINHQIGVFTIKKRGASEGPKKEKDGYSIIARNYVLSSFEIGQQTIPSLKVKYTSKHGEGEVATNEITVDIKGVLNEGEISDDIKDIFPPVSVPVSFNRLVPWIYVGLAVFFLTGIIYWLIRKRKRGSKPQELVFAKRPPHEVAYELLEGLSKEDLIAKGLIREYYYRITDVVRHYIEDRFGLLAPERTTEEFLTEMSHTNQLNDAHKRLIQEFLERCDMVKYARYGPSKTEIQETYDAAKRLIDETRECLEEKEVIAG
jgi:hypothetical protein